MSEMDDAHKVVNVYKVVDRVIVGLDEGIAYRVSHVVTDVGARVLYSIGRWTKPLIAGSALFCYSSYAQAFQRRSASSPFVSLNTEIWRARALNSRPPHKVPFSAYPVEIHEHFWRSLRLANAQSTEEIDSAIKDFRAETGCQVMSPPEGTIFCDEVLLEEILWTRAPLDCYPRNYEKPKGWD